jgi:hypothetical protein
MTFSFPFSPSIQLSLILPWQPTHKIFSLETEKQNGSWKIQVRKDCSCFECLHGKPTRKNFFWAYLNFFKTYPNKKIGPKNFAAKENFYVSMCIFPFPALFFFHACHMHACKGYSNTLMNSNQTQASTKLQTLVHYLADKNNLLDVCIGKPWGKLEILFIALFVLFNGRES